MLRCYLGMWEFLGDLYVCVNSIAVCVCVFVFAGFQIQTDFQNQNHCTWKRYIATV